MNGPSAPAAFYVLRAFLLAAAAASIGLAFWLSHDRSSSSESEVTFACPMHPDVVTAAPGECPICRMALERRAPAEPSMPRGGILPGSFSLRPGVRSLTRYDLVKARRLEVTRAVVAPAWLESADEGVALVYRDESARGTGARFVTRAGGEVDARVAIEPAAPWDALFVRVRFHLVPGDGTRRAGDVGWLRSSIDGQSVMVPYSAVLESPSGPGVFVASADGRTLARRAVDVGRLYFGQATTVSGLVEGEAVSISPFAMAAEARLSSRPGDRASARP